MLQEALWILEKIVDISSWDYSLVWHFKDSSQLRLRQGKSFTRMDFRMSWWAFRLSFKGIKIAYWSHEIRYQFLRLQRNDSSQWRRCGFKNRRIWAYSMELAAKLWFLKCFWSKSLQQCFKWCKSSNLSQKIRPPTMSCSIEARILESGTHFSNIKK